MSLKFLAGLFSGAVLACGLGTAGAHGDWPPKHGGLMSRGGEITMELVSSQSGVLIYVEDHGEPVDVQAGAAELEIAEPDGKTRTLALNTIGGNRLQSTAPLRLSTGMRLLATVRFKGGIEYKGRFYVTSP